MGATTLNGFDLALTYRLDARGRFRDSAINPRSGRRLALRYNRYFNWFISGFEENTSLLIETYDRYFYNRFSLDWNEFIPLGPGPSALNFRFFGGLIDSRVDDAFDFFLGGLPGMKGYTFYSMEGRRALMLRSAYRFPILSRIDQQTGPVYSDQLYGAFFAGLGRAWDGTPDDAGAQPRLETRIGRCNCAMTPLRFTFSPRAPAWMWPTGLTMCRCNALAIPLNEAV